MAVKAVVAQTEPSLPKPSECSKRMARVVAYREAKLKRLLEGLDMVANAPSGYSTTVRIELLAGAERFFPAQVGDGRIMFERDVVLPGSEGVLILHIDEHVRRWRLNWEASDVPSNLWIAKFRDVEYPAADAATTPARTV